MQSVPQEAEQKYCQEDMGTDPQIVTGKKHGLPEILDFSPVAHNQLFRVASLNADGSRGTERVRTGGSLWNGHAHGE